MILKEGETGYDNLDTLRFNKSCIARHCSTLSAPENGRIISSINNNGRFAFPQIVQFACNFGHQVLLINKQIYKYILTLFSISLFFTCLAKN